MIENLADILKRSILESTESVIAEQQGISTSDARDIVKEMSFSDYLRLREATTQGTMGTMGTAGPTTPPGGQPATPARPYNAATIKKGEQTGFNNVDGSEGAGTVIGQTGDVYDIETADGQRLQVARDNLLDPSNLRDASLIAATKNLAGHFDRGMAHANRDKVKITQSAEHDEIGRLQELAGIGETSTAGGTGAGGIAMSQSIVGNTAHKPTDQLRAKLRRKKEKKK